ncbi:MAG: DUF3084 domain-containing protein [Cloacibacillus porcorum]|uniref:DUF3084 domain-containing protein n=1 Tax=Cloacibacillus porcorum TaxID=1197717 RepID=UPI0023F1B9C8|nr:DUF3084 domain-containing protein [Cloacibacillus porcorum]MCD7877829.1 DUF3084 domain-containing protein [Cloacibacillus porcorum]
MFEIFHDINWILLGSLIIVSALVSWAGDVIGMKLGKKRITFLKIRPKYTSRIISVLTGVGITIATIFVLSAASEQVRTALFSMQVIQRQLISTREELKKNEESMGRMEIDLFQSRGDLSEKEAELRQVEEKLDEGMKSLNETRAKLAAMTRMRDETEAEQAVLQKEKDKLLAESKKLDASVKALKAESESLKSGIQRLREGRIAAFTGEILAQGVMTDSIITTQQVDQYINRLRSEARALLAYRFGGKDPESVRLPEVAAESAAKVRERLTHSPGRWLLRLTALGNAVEGEAVQAQIEAYRSRLIYRENQLLYSHTFEPDTPRHKIEETVFQALRSLNQKAANDGVLRDPISGNVGSIDTGEFITALDKISQVKSSIKLEILTARDIYSEGPLRVNFVLN